LRKHGKNVLRANKAAVKEGEAGKGHEKHERSAGHHPGVVTRTWAGNV